METNNLEEFNVKFQVNTLSVYKSKYWTWSVRPTQVTLGSGVLSLNRYALHLSDLTEEEMADLKNIVSKIENTLKKTFGYDIMNYLMLMMVDHHVHYHVIPRYDGIKLFDGLEWVDNGWPALPVMGDSQHKNREVILDKIRDELKNNL